MPSKSGLPHGTAEEAFSGQPVTDTPEGVIEVWNITPGRVDKPEVPYAGIQPAALFKSTGRGETWSLNESLYDHPQRGQWNPGAGGLRLHTIVLDPQPGPHICCRLGGGRLPDRRRRADLETFPAGLCVGRPSERER